MIRVGVSPVLWSNEDHPVFGADITFERCLDEAEAAGYEGIELGYKFPRNPSHLRRALHERSLRLVGSWHSTGLLEHDLEDELRVLRPLADLLLDLGATTIVVAEGTGSVVRDRGTPLSSRPVLHPEGMRSFGDKLTRLADRLGEQGLALAYHHHIGTVVESYEDLEALVASTGSSVGLTLDTGHAAFAGFDLGRTIESHGARIRHVHVKDVRTAVLRDIAEAPVSFVDAVAAGVFAVPGEGDLELRQPLHELLHEAGGYDGWFVVEADHDPAVVEPAVVARRGREFVRGIIGR